MASAVKTDSTGKYVVVEKGDTLSQIAVTYKSTSGNKTYQQLAQLNGISNPNYIRIGQKIYLTKTSSGGGSTTTASTTKSDKLVIDNIGIQSNGDGKTVFVTWTWSRSNTEKFEIIWKYATGDGVAFMGTQSDVESWERSSTYTMPSQAYKVMVQVKPIAKLKSDNKTRYWTENWTHKEFVRTENIIGAAPAPNIEIKDNDITVSISDVDLGSLNASGIEFQVGMNDNEIVNSGKAKIDSDTQYASYKCTVAPGNEYKARARAYRNWGGETYYGEWSNWSSAVSSMPAAPSGITSIKADSKTSVELKWSAVANADSYDIEYATNKNYFDASDQTTVKNTGSKNTTYYITGLSTDDEYFFRVRAVKSDVASEWSGVKSIKLGVKPSAPTTWASTTTLTTGDPLTLYWVHNTEGGSSQSKAHIIVTSNGSNIVDVQFDTNVNKTHTYFTYTAPKDLEEGEVATSAIKFNTSSFAVGTKLTWKVRTAGISGEFGDWSIDRTIDVYAKVSLGIKVANKNGTEIKTLNAFPFYITGSPSGGTQKPIGYHVSVISNQTYETIDNVGNPKTINKGEEIYAKYFDTTSFSEKLNGVAYDLVVPMSAGNINVDDGMSYTVQATVTMDSGMTATSKTSFNVSWTEVSYKLNAEVSVDKENLVAHVKPYAKQYSYIYYKVIKSGTATKPVYTATDEEIAAVWGMEIPKALTTKGTKIGKQVFEGILADGTEILYYEVEKATSNSDVTLAIYRREFDGTFTKLATGINNTKNTFVTDPHPALDYARYRVVATNNSTGAISYYDVPGVPIGEPAVVIQWHDTWVNFDSSEDAPPVHAWSGSMLKIPYNIDIAPRTSKDISLVNYIGRKHPVVYYGTHVGETDTWNVEIPKDDTDLLYALRRLAIWMDRVYVREPSGSGYWADISVSFSKKHCEVTIPVTFDITRVEGGA